MVQMTDTRAFPLKDDCRILVSFESRYGICALKKMGGQLTIKSTSFAFEAQCIIDEEKDMLPFFFFSYPFSSVSFAMTVPRVSSDLLMKAPSLRRSMSADAFSDPARSIRFSCETRTAVAGLESPRLSFLPGLGLEGAVLSRLSIT